MPRQPKESGNEMLLPNKSERLIKQQGDYRGERKGTEGNHMSMAVSFDCSAFRSGLIVTMGAAPEASSASPVALSFHSCYHRQAWAGRGD